MSTSDELKKNNDYNLSKNRLKFVKTRLMRLKLTDGSKIEIQKLQQEMDNLISELKILKMRLL